MTKYIIVDVESDGPLIGFNSMVCFGAVLLDRKLETTFYGQTRALGVLDVASTIYDATAYNSEALAISGFTREEHENFPHPLETMELFKEWIDRVRGNNSVVLLSDNNGYDASWINYYFHTFIGKNPFGWSSRRIGDWFAGFYNDPYYKWKKHRISKHTHHPVDDARGNAEAVLYLIDQGFKLKIL